MMSSTRSPVSGIDIKIVLAITLLTTTTLASSFTVLAIAQSNTSVTKKPANTFSMDGAISSLVLGMPPNTKTVDMTNVQKFILSGNWSMGVNKGNLTSFGANFYTGPVNGGTTNHTHQLSNFRVNNTGDNNIPIQLSPDKSVSISGILDVATNGKKVWNNAHTTVLVSNGRTISITLADKDDQRHFMGQPLYGIVKSISVS